MCLVMTHSHEPRQARSPGLQRWSRGYREGNRLAGGHSFYFADLVSKKHLIHLICAQDGEEGGDGSLRASGIRGQLYIPLGYDHRPDNSMTDSLGLYQ